MSQHKPKAYSYRRFSNPEQGKGRSEARQWNECVAYCQEHQLDLVNEVEYTFLDKGKSAYHKEQLSDTGQLKLFFDMIEDGRIQPGSYLIVESLDRLGRDRVIDALGRFMDILRAGINIVTLTDRRTYTQSCTEMELMVSIIVMSRAHEESSTKAKRVTDAQKKKQERARSELKPMGAAAPLWLTYDGHEYKEHVDRANTVRRIFKMCIDGYGRGVIAQTLNAEGVLAFRAAKAEELTEAATAKGMDGEDAKLRYQKFRGVGWGLSSVQKVLTNRAVLGEYQPNARVNKVVVPRGEPIKGYYPAIIDEATFYAAQAATAQRLTGKVTKTTKNFNLWTGVAKCALCMSPMHLVNKGKPPKGNTYLRCSSAGKGMCKNKIIRLDQSEVVFPHILKRLDSGALVQDHAQKVERSLAEIEGRLIERRQQYEESKTILAVRATLALNEAIGRLEDEIAQLERSAEEHKRQLARERPNWAEFLQKVDLTSYSGRSRANALLKRLKVFVFMSKGGYMVEEDGDVTFVTAYDEGTVASTEFDEVGPYVPEYASQIDGMLSRIKQSGFRPMTVDMKAVA